MNGPTPEPETLLGAMRLIASANIKASEKAVCWALLTFADRVTREAFPSVPTLGKAAGLKERATRKVLARLNAAGIVSYVERSAGGVRKNGRGKSHLFRLELTAIAAMNPAANAGLNAARDAVQPGTEGLQTRHETTRNPAPNAGEPSIHPSKELTKEPSMPKGGHGVARFKGGCVDGQNIGQGDLRSALARAGIRGPNLEVLASAKSLTPHDVGAELLSIQSDASVRNAQAVLVRRLAARCGVTLKTGPRLGKAADNAIAEIERLRRARTMESESTSANRSNRLYFGHGNTDGITEEGA